MKISREKVEANRARIVAEAGRLFRERGLEKVSVGEVMRAAGLTHGGFYNHFESKDALIAAALGDPQSPPPLPSPLEARAYADRYLSDAHRRNAGDGCDFAGLGSEAVRAAPAARHALTARLKAHIERFTPTAAGDTDAARRAAAISNWATMVGAMTLARLSDDAELSEEILTAARESLRL